MSSLINCNIVNFIERYILRRSEKYCSFLKSVIIFLRLSFPQTFRCSAFAREIEGTLHTKYTMCIVAHVYNICATNVLLKKIWRKKGKRRDIEICSIMILKMKKLYHFTSFSTLFVAFKMILDKMLYICRSSNVFIDQFWWFSWKLNI